LNVPSATNYWIAADGRHSFLTTLLNGRTLEAELSERQHLPIDAAVRYGCHVLNALLGVHASGLVHRNINTKSLFLHQHKHRGIQAYVLGFRLARNISVDPDAGRFHPVEAARTRDMIGPTYFASPEALQGMRVDARSDIYSLGVVLYVMLLGLSDVESDHSTRPTFSLSALRSVKGWTQALERVIQRSLEPRAEDRYQTAAEFLFDLSLHLPSSPGSRDEFSTFRLRHEIWSLQR
jgi:serine/threonine-protein kinase